MIKKVFISVVLLAFMTVALVQAMEKEGNKEKLPGIQAGVKAPDFTLKTLSGDKVSLSDFYGKKVILNFWATWCPPCKDEMPEMEDFYKENKDEVVILAINIDPQYNVQDFIDKMDVHFPVLLDEKDEVNTKYQVLTIPTTYFIDEEGIIQHKYLTTMTKEILIQYTEDL